MFDWPTPAALRILGLTFATLAAAGIMAWGIASAVNHSSRAAQASSQTTLELSEQAIALQQQRNQAALLGECQGRDALTVQVDAAHRVMHRILIEAAALTRSIGGRGRVGRVRRRLAREYETSARAVKQVTQTRCDQELAHPLTYSKPVAIPFR